MLRTKLLIYHRRFIILVVDTSLCLSIYLAQLPDDITSRDSPIKHCFSKLSYRGHLSKVPRTPLQSPINSTNTLPNYPNSRTFNPLNPELKPICYLLALLAHHFLHVSRIMVKSLPLRLLMSYMYGVHILDVSRSHTTTQHSR